MKKILIFGKNGQVAWELQRSCAILGEVKACGSHEVNLERPQDIVNTIRSYRPDYIVNAAAYTAVDKAESEESIANQVNGHSVGAMAEEAKAVGAKLIHYSTDYVFDGSKETPYVESDPTNPVNAYGRSKLLGEKYIQEVGGDSVVLRVSWVYGTHGNNFYKTMLRLGADREQLKVVADQFGVPTWSRHIADASAHILRDAEFSAKKGIYHLTPQGKTNWCEFAQEIFKLTAEIKPQVALKVREVSPIGTVDFPTPAKRPKNSMMDSNNVYKQFGVKLPNWMHSLKLVVQG
jgi:dTDP-4-dehydrorhamnose reductase